MGSAWRRDGALAVWAEVPTPSSMGCELILAVHEGLVTSVIKVQGAMGRGLGGPGSRGELDRVSIPPDGEPTRRANCWPGPRRCLGGVVPSLLGEGSAARPSSASAPGSSHALAPPRRWRLTASTSAGRARSGAGPPDACAARPAARVLPPDLASDRRWSAATAGRGSVPIAPTCEAADHRHHDHHCPDLADRRSLPFESDALRAVGASSEAGSLGCLARGSPSGACLPRGGCHPERRRPGGRLHRHRRAWRSAAAVEQAQTRSSTTIAVPERGANRRPRARSLSRLHGLAGRTRSARSVRPSRALAQAYARAAGPSGSALTGCTSIASSWARLGERRAAGEPRA